VVVHIEPVDKQTGSARRKAEVRGEIEEEERLRRQEPGREPEPV
jgi:hypothetical protein